MKEVEQTKETEINYESKENQFQLTLETNEEQAHLANE